MEWNTERDMRVSCSFDCILACTVWTYFIIFCFAEGTAFNTWFFFFLPKMYQWCNCKNGLDVRSDVGSWVCVGGRHCWYPILIPPPLPVLSLHVLAASCVSIHGSAWGPLWLLGPCLGQVQYSRELAPWERRQLGYLRLESQNPSFHLVDGPTLRCFYSIPRDPSKGEFWLPVVVLCWLTGPLLASFISLLPYCASWDHLTSCTWTLVSECALREPKPKTYFSLSGKLTAFVFWAGCVGWGGSEEVSTF